MNNQTTLHHTTPQKNVAKQGEQVSKLEAAINARKTNNTKANAALDGIEDDALITYKMLAVSTYLLNYCHNKPSPVVARKREPPHTHHHQLALQSPHLHIHTYIHTYRHKHIHPCQID
jgi:hypothetical protein